MGLFDRLKGEGQGEKAPAGSPPAGETVEGRRAELEIALRQAEAAGDSELIELVEIEMRELEARDKEG